MTEKTKMISTYRMTTRNLFILLLLPRWQMSILNIFRPPDKFTILQPYWSHFMMLLLLEIYHLWKGYSMMPKVQGSNPLFLPTMYHHQQQDLLYCMSRQVVDIVICRFGVSNRFIVWSSSMLIHSVIENCGAMPDLEDREGEVSFIRSEYFTSYTNI